MLSRTEKWKEKREEIKNQSNLLIQLMDCPLIKYDRIFEEADEYDAAIRKLLNSIIDEEGF